MQLNTVVFSQNVYATWREKWSEDRSDVANDICYTNHIC